MNQPLTQKGEYAYLLCGFVLVLFFFLKQVWGCFCPSVRLVFLKWLAVNQEALILIMLLPVIWTPKYLLIPPLQLPGSKFTAFLRGCTKSLSTYQHACRDQLAVLHEPGGGEKAEGCRAVVPAWKAYQGPKEIKVFLGCPGLSSSFAPLQLTRAVMILSYSA